MFGGHRERRISWGMEIGGGIVAAGATGSDAMPANVRDVVDLFPRKAKLARPAI